MTRSLSFQVLSGFVIVASLLTVLLIANNGYAMNVVRSQIADANRLLLTSNATDLENRFAEINANLFRFISQDPDIQTFSYRQEESERFFTAQRIISKFKLLISRRVDAYFAYKASSNDLIFVTADGVQQIALSDAIEQLLSQGEANAKKWFPVNVKGRAYMFRVIPYNKDLSVGAAVSAERLTENLPMWDLAKHQGVNLLKDDWTLFDDTGFPQEDMTAIMRAGIDAGRFRTVDDPGIDAPFQLVGRKLESAQLTVIYTIPEAQLLANLPHFQRLINLLPWLMLAIILFYLLYMQQIVLKPMKRLIKGMHRIKNGQLDIRLPERTITREFTTLNGTFNQMASEIHELKLAAYEKQLQAQEARLKQLQAQINPHFFMNALNIAYSLAGLREYQLVQKLIALIVEFLRFITRNTGDHVTIDQELAHIRNYLEIHKLRFPERVAYTCEIDEGLKSVLIPPLIVQPIVENAIIHGFKQESGVFEITITVVPSGGTQLEIIVRDNGPGFPDSYLQTWKTGLTIPGSHIGIANIVERLAIIYGSEAELVFENVPEGGALVRLRIPRPQAKEVP